jgi:hypothetical protein
MQDDDQRCARRKTLWSVAQHGQLAGIGAEVFGALEGVVAVSCAK